MQAAIRNSRATLRVLEAVAHLRGCVIRVFTPKEANSLSQTVKQQIFEACKKNNETFAISRHVTDVETFETSLFKPDQYASDLGAAADFLFVIVLFEMNYDTRNKNKIKVVGACTAFDTMEPFLAHQANNYESEADVPFSYKSIVRFDTAHQRFERLRPNYTVRRRHSAGGHYMTYKKSERKNICQIELLCSKKQGLGRLMIFYLFVKIGMLKRAGMYRYKHIFLENMAKPFARTKRFYESNAFQQINMHNFRILENRRRGRGGTLVPKRAQWRSVRVSSPRGKSLHMFSRHTTNGGFVPLMRPEDTATGQAAQNHTMMRALHMNTADCRILFNSCRFYTQNGKRPCK